MDVSHSVYSNVVKVFLFEQNNFFSWKTSFHSLL